MFTMYNVIVVYNFRVLFQHIIFFLKRFLVGRKISFEKYKQLHTLHGLEFSFLKCNLVRAWFLRSVGTYKAGAV